jgi:hypothetical protein
MPGEFALTIREGSYSVASAIVSKPIPATGGTNKNISTLGNSNTRRGFQGDGAGWGEIVGDELTGRAIFRGTVTPPSPWHYKHDARDGEQWETLDSSGSPLFAGGATLNIPAFIAQLGATPDIVIFDDLGQNIWYGLTLTQVQSAFDAAMVHAENIFAAFRSAVPGIPFLITTGYPISANPAAGLGTWDAVLAMAAKAKLWAKLTTDYFSTSAKIADGYHLAHTLQRVDPVRGYTSDAIHLNAWGHTNASGPIGAAIVHALWT